MRILHACAAVALFATFPLATAAQQDPLYATPQDALEALMGALETGTGEAVVAALGAEAEGLVRDDVAPDRATDWELILAVYREGYRFVPLDEGRVSIELGSDDWPFPIELARAEGGWRFDVASGREEIIGRLIGLNELDVIDVMKAYVGIQQDFRQVDHDGDGVLEFASSIISSADARDGLYWPGGDSPVGDDRAVHCSDWAGCSSSGCSSSRRSCCVL